MDGWLVKDVSTFQRTQNKMFEVLIRVNRIRQEVVKSFYSVSHASLICIGGRASNRWAPAYLKMTRFMVKVVATDSNPKDWKVCLILPEPVATDAGSPFLHAASAVL